MQPYPFDRLPRVPRDELARLRAQARGGPLAALTSGAPDAAAWLGAACTVELRGRPRAHVPLASDPIACVLLDDLRGGRSALVLEPSLASAIVDRTMGGDGGVEPEAGPLREVERGVLAYAIARWIAGRSAFTVAGVVTSAPALAAHVDADAVEWPLAIAVGAVRGGASLVLPRELAPAPARGPWPGWARALPIELAVEAASALLPAREIASLRTGDVVVPDPHGLAIDDGAIAGEVLLVTGGPRAFRAELRGGELRIIAIELRTPRTRGTKEVHVSEPDRSLESLGGTPVLLTLELARFTLPLEEIAALAPGEVVRTGAAIGASVALRAGDRVIARGELVDVDGEVGVRILALERT